MAQHHESLYLRHHVNAAHTEENGGLAASLGHVQSHLRQIMVAASS